jgi:P-type conjugative transfer protein TrbG
MNAGAAAQASDGSSPAGQVYPIPAFRTTDVPLPPERRADLVTKQARAEASRTLSPQEQAGVKMTDEWAAKSAEFQTQSNLNGSVVLSFNSSLPTVTAAVLELTDVELQAGESVASVNIGDTARWVIVVTNSQEGELQRPHLIIKPLDEGLKTSLVVTTTKRTYHLLLQSSFDRFMHYVTFAYPEDPEVTALQQRRAAELAALQAASAKAKADAEAKLPKPTVPGPPLPTVYYRIEGKAPWRPLYAYTDGVKTYIRMSPGMSQTEAPSLLALRRGKGWWGDDKVMVNYRVQQGRYVVDSVIDRAVMVIGREEVKLTKKSASAPKKAAYVSLQTSEKIRHEK